ncbi:MAG: hypothetical protein KBC56_07830, partial [Flavobacterium sp.]|nr:hypothetical protein [Flavobacterium sp.]
MNQADIATFNSRPSRPFNIIANTFEQGLSSGNFGYVRIESITTGTHVWGRVNLEGSTVAPPWGTLEGPNGSKNANYLEKQLVEVAIDLTAFGLDRRDETLVDPCSNLLGSLLVKTRSSAGGNSDSFTSELKDFAGPYVFGRSTNPTVSLAQGTPLSCTNTCTTLTATVNDMAGVSVLFTDANGVVLPADGPEPDFTRVVCAGGTYNVRVDAYAFPGCFRTDSIVVAPYTPNELEVACPQVVSINACATPEAIQTAFDNWKAGFSVNNNGGGGLVTNLAQVANLQLPPLCGGEVSFQLNAHDNCNVQESCNSSFTITPVPQVLITEPEDDSINACAGDEAILVDYNAWKAQFSVSGGCSPQGVITGDGALNYCGDSITLTYTVDDKCYNQQIRTATFTITPAPAVVVSDVQNASISACASEADINAAYAAWLGSFGVSGGCNPQGG